MNDWEEKTNKLCSISRVTVNRISMRLKLISNRNRFVSKFKNLFEWIFRLSLNFSSSYFQQSIFKSHHNRISINIRTEMIELRFRFHLDRLTKWPKRYEPKEHRPILDSTTKKQLCFEKHWRRKKNKLMCRRLNILYDQQQIICELSDPFSYRWYFVVDWWKLISFDHLIAIRSRSNV